MNRVSLIIDAQIRFYNPSVEYILNFKKELLHKIFIFVLFDNTKYLKLQQIYRCTKKKIYLSYKSSDIKKMRQM